jgi:2-dehydropantoate 2-reductase
MAAQWHVLGSGAIGCLFASALQRAGCMATLLVRANDSPVSGPVNQTSIQIEAQGIVGEFVFPLSKATDSAYIRHLLIATKAHDARSALASIAHRLDEASQVLLLVNGMGVLDELASDYPQLEYFGGTTTEGAYRKSRREIVHAGSGITRIGSEQHIGAPHWFNDWSGLALACTWENNINAALWEKLAVNCAINPLTALARCRNGELGSRADLAAQLAPLCDEIASITAAAGHPSIAAGIHQRVNDVIDNTGDNRSSMLQDVLAGRPTEIEYISGYLVTLASQLQVPAPLNESLLHRVRKIVQP